MKTSQMTTTDFAGKNTVLQKNCANFKSLLKTLKINKQPLRNQKRDRIPSQILDMNYLDLVHGVIPGEYCT